MQISSAEAYDLLSHYVKEHRRVRCIFQAPQTLWIAARHSWADDI